MSQPLKRLNNQNSDKLALSVTVALYSVTFAVSTAILVWLKSSITRRYGHKLKGDGDNRSEGKDTNENGPNDIDYLPTLVPLYRAGKVFELVDIILQGGTANWIRKRRHQQPNQYIFRTYGFEDFFQRKEGASQVLVTHYDDVQYLFSKQRKLQLPLSMPESVARIHGPQSFLLMTDFSEHDFYRKIFSSLLSPRAMESFIPYIYDAFIKMWQKLEQPEHKHGDNRQGEGNKATNSSPKEIILRNEIRKTQFYLMSKILYGIDVEKEPDLCHHLQENFELEDAALFAPVNSKQFQKGYEASQETRKILWERFRGALDKVQKRKGHQGREQKDHVGEMKAKVGNAFEAIAEALVETGKDKDEHVLSGIEDNLLLLLEASHGTTMHVTTVMMYYLNHAIEAEKKVSALQRLQQEFHNLLVSDNSSVASSNHPYRRLSFAELKDSLPYADSVIKESMRLCPMVTMVSLFLEKGEALKLPKRQNENDATMVASQNINHWNIRGPAHLILASSHWYCDESLYLNANDFQPERWLEYAKIGTSPPPPQLTAFVPFGGGAHICLGMQLAKLVLKINLLCFCCYPSASPTNGGGGSCEGVDLSTPDKDLQDDTSKLLPPLPRRIVFDPKKVYITPNLFPEQHVKDGLPCQVISCQN